MMTCASQTTLITHNYNLARS